MPFHTLPSTSYEPTLALIPLWCAASFSSLAITTQTLDGFRRWKVGEQFEVRHNSEEWPHQTTSREHIEDQMCCQHYPKFFYIKSINLLCSLNVQCWMYLERSDRIVPACTNFTPHYTTCIHNICVPWLKYCSVYLSNYKSIFVSLNFNSLVLKKKKKS